MDTSLPPFERTHCSTEHRSDHALGRRELAGEAIIACGRPHVARPSRQRREQAGRRTERAAEFRRASYRTRDMPRSITKIPARTTAAAMKDRDVPSGVRAADQSRGNFPMLPAADLAENRPPTRAEHRRAQPST